MDKISKSFPGVKALDEVTFELKSGSVHALMGENGAGKSTLMKCLFGVYSHDSGKILLDGKEVSFKSSKDALLHGVAMVHQELNQALSLSVMDNMWLGRFPKVLPPLPIVSERRMYEETKKIFDSLSIDTSPKSKMSELSVSKRQMVEIAKAVSYRARVIVFDEPTSSLNESEAEHLFKIIDKLKKDGCGIIYISHKMEEILRICDTVTVMRDGRHIETRAAANITTDEIIRLMVGRSLSQRYPQKNPSITDTILTVDTISGEYSQLDNVSFDLKRGEVLGIAGLDGSGRSELLETIFGMRKRRGGKIALSGKVCENKSPREAIRNGFALVTEERRKNGIFAILSVMINTAVSSFSAHKRLGFLSEKKMRRSTIDAITSLKIKTPSYKTKIESLSGGNQQKVIFARWLLTNPDVLLLDEPTRGIDVGAKYEIYKLILDLASRGKGVIIVSSEMPELIGISDRIIVMSGGKIAGELAPSEFTQEKIMTLASKYT